MFRVLLVLLAIMLPNAALASCDQLAGDWVNERGSRIHLENADSKTGHFHGKFLSEAAIKDGGQFPLAGWVNTAAATEARPHMVQSVAFIVRWGATGSITSWTGYCRRSGDNTEIITLWHLVRSNSENDFDHVHAGSDVFVQQETGLQ